MIDLSYEEMKSLDIGNSIKGEYIGDTKKLKGAVVKGKVAGLVRSNKGHLYVLIAGKIEGDSQLKIHNCREDEFRFYRTRLMLNESMVYDLYIEGYLNKLKEREDIEKEEKVLPYKKYEGGQVTDFFCKGAFGRVYDLDGAEITKVCYEKRENGKGYYWLEVLKNKGEYDEEKDYSVNLSKEGLERLLDEFCVEKLS